MRIVCMSDTHNLHEKVQVPDGDVVIHSGDWTGSGTQQQVIKFIRWLASLPHKHKILIAGNHEVTLDRSLYEAQWWRFHRIPEPAHDLKAYVMKESSIHYLEDQSLVVEGVSFYGSPVTPTFGDWGFNVRRGLPIRAVWSNIPTNTQVLITHGPPMGFGDLLVTGERVGCESLLEEVTNRIKPRLHVFGHIHNGYGLYESGGTSFVNASICDEGYKCVNAPIVFDL